MKYLFMNFKILLKQLEINIKNESILKKKWEIMNIDPNIYQQDFRKKNISDYNYTDLN